MGARHRFWLGIGLTLVVGCGAGAFRLTQPIGVSRGPRDAHGEQAAAAAAAPELHHDDGYVSSQACRGCHQREYASWHASYHRRMTQRPSREAVLPPWAHGTQLRAHGRSYRLLRRGETFVVDMPRYGTAGRAASDRVELPVAMTTGSHHFQLFWVTPPWSATDPSAGRERFVSYCGDCHAEESTATGGSLLDRELAPDEVRAALQNGTHRPALRGLSVAARQQIVRFVERLQTTGRLVQFPLAWSVEDQRWVHEDHTFVGPPQPPALVEPYDQVWEDACDACHSVAPQRPTGELGAPARARVAELGIACEACHGPGREHVDHHRSGSAATSTAATSTVATSTVATGTAATGTTAMIVPSELDHERASAVCARCHADVLPHAARLAEVFRPGDRLEAHAHVVRYGEPPHPPWLAAGLADDPQLLSGAFWRDGTMRIAGRDYNALSESACYLRGELACTSCHRLHGADPNDQLRPEAKDNRVCASCHQSIATNPTEHTHHRADSPGSLCYNCHAPHTTLGLLKAIRSHRIDSPRAANSATTGRPNACNLCHLDMTLQQTANQLSAWYDQPRFEDTSERREIPAAVGWLLSGDAAQRAVAAWHFGFAPAQTASGRWWLAAPLAQALDDPYAAVRRIAQRSLATLPEGRELGYDFVAPAAARQRARDEVLTRFAQRQRATPPGARPGALLKLLRDPTALPQLATQRDDTPVVINE
jgi:predicted CXXCH cytochrome family protein